VTGLRLLLASGRYEDAEIAAFREAVRFDDLLGAAEGELELMGVVATALEAENA
jgi:hypothetical protein